MYCKLRKIHYNGIMERLLWLIILILASACTPQVQQATPTPANTQTLSPTATLTPQPTETALPTPTPLPTTTPIPEPIVGPLYDWPLLPLSDEQIQDVLDCQNATWTGGNEVVPREIKIDELVTACDFGLKALSLVTDFDTFELSDLGIYYAQQALLINPGILFANPYFFFAFIDVEVVESPVPSDRVVQEMNIHYKWSGIGSLVNYSVTITNGEIPRAVGNVTLGPGPEDDHDDTTSWTIQQELEPGLLENWGESFINLIPVKRQGMMYACFDNYPNWVIQVTFDDGWQLDLSSNWSNFFLEGGPFQTRLEDQNYVMASYNFNLVLNRIIETLELPYGEPWAMSCHPYPVVEGLYTDLPIPDYFP